MDTVMPGPGIWDQYTVAGIMFIVIVTIGLAVRKVFHEYRDWQSIETEKQRKWQEEQFEKRELENVKQRSWYSEMEKQREVALADRDKQWTAMVREIQALVDRRDRESHQALMELTGQIRLLTESLAAHDARVDDRMKKFEDYVNTGRSAGSQKRRIS